MIYVSATNRKLTEKYVDWAVTGLPGAVKLNPQDISKKTDCKKAIMFGVLRGTHLVYNYAKKMNDQFSVIGPRFLNASKKGHFQTNPKYKIKKIHNVHGSTIFFCKKVFLKNKGFDPNIFLYWEETDYTKRAIKNGYNFIILGSDLFILSEWSKRTSETINRLRK